VSSSTPAIPEAYGAGHLPGAVNVPEIFTDLATSTPEGIRTEDEIADACGDAGLRPRKPPHHEQSMNSGFGQSCRGLLSAPMLGIPSSRCGTAGYDAWPPRACRVPRTCLAGPRKSSRVLPEAGVS